MTLPFCLSVFVENFFIGSWTSPKLGFFADFLDTDITNLTGMQLWAGGGGWRWPGGGARSVPSAYK
jgi:hypothetical protein